METEKRGCTKADVLKRVKNLTPRQVQFYTEEKVITPDVDSGRGRGRARRYSLRAVFAFAVLGELLEYSLTLAAVKNLMWGFLSAADKWWDDESNAPKKAGLFFTALKASGRGWMLSIRPGDGDRITMLLNRHASALVVSLDRVIEKSGF
ncbi:hypothetical protein TRIP_B170092 [uncultured Desulfatiglans sp.]|nr:hypothetical protein TRIP_B170092 [uncultured Desulfatiglans sp.]